MPTTIAPSTFLARADAVERVTTTSLRPFVVTSPAAAPLVLTVHTGSMCPNTDLRDLLDMNGYGLADALESACQSGGGNRFAPPLSTTDTWLRER